MIILILILIMMVGLKQELGGSSGHGGQLDRVPGAILGEATTSLSHSTHPPTNTNSYTNTNTDYMHMKQLRREGTKLALISFH